MLTGTGLPAPFLRRKAKDLASGSGWACHILRAGEGEVVGQLDEELRASWSWGASEVDFCKDCATGSCPRPAFPGSRCGARWQPDSGVSGLGGDRPLQQRWRLDSVCGGVWPLSLRATVGSSGCEKRSFPC